MPSREIYPPVAGDLRLPPWTQPYRRRRNPKHSGAKDVRSSAQKLQEMLHRYLALRRWPEGKRVVLDFAALTVGLIEPVTAEDAVLACDLLHAAVMLRAEGDEAKIVSADCDFDELAAEGIERLDPADVEVCRQEVERGRAWVPPRTRGYRRSCSSGLAVARA